jgi:transposase
MGKAYSEDLRKRAVDLVNNEGEKVEDICSVLKLSRSSLYLWLKQKKETGSVAAKTGYQRGYGHKVKDLDKFKKFIDENVGLNAVELAKKWPIPITPKTIRIWLHRIEYTQKKRLIFIKSKMKKSVKYIWKK